MPMLYPLPLTAWDEALPAAESAIATDALEAGHILVLPNLRFELTDAERAYFTDRPRRVATTALTLPQFRAMLDRYATATKALVRTLFPVYRSGLEVAPPSVPSRAPRKPDPRLRIDTDTGRPSHGKRILKVFANVSIDGRAAVWRVGEPFEAVASRFWHELRPPLPGERGLLAAVRFSTRARSRYDHYMLKLRDAMRSDVGYQGEFAAATREFAAGTAWVCFTDQVSHAVVGGGPQMEQAFWVDVKVLRHQESAPLRVLEGLAGRKLA
jgi:hypothetical protein